MRLSDFILLDERSKKHLLINQGILIAKRKTSEHSYFLFQWSNFYVELVGNLPGKTVERFTVYNELHGLQPYLDSLTLNDILPE